jgi:hypothetical protein
MALGAAFANFLRDCKKPRKQRKFRCLRFKKRHSTYRLRFGTISSTSLAPRPNRQARLGGDVRGTTLHRKNHGGGVAFSGGRWFRWVQVDTDGERDWAATGTFAASILVVALWQRLRAVTMQLSLCAARSLGNSRSVVSSGCSAESVYIGTAPSDGCKRRNQPAKNRAG